MFHYCCEGGTTRSTRQLVSVRVSTYQYQTNTQMTTKTNTKMTTKMQNTKEDKEKLTEFAPPIVIQKMSAQDDTSKWSCWSCLLSWQRINGFCSSDFGGSGDADVSLQYLKPVAVLDHEPLRFLTVLSLPAESHYKSLMNWSSPRFIMSIRFIGWYEIRIN